MLRDRLLRWLSFEMRVFSDLYLILAIQKWAEKVDCATFSAEWKFALINPLHCQSLCDYNRDFYR